MDIVFNLIVSAILALGVVIFFWITIRAIIKRTMNYDDEIDQEDLKHDDIDQIDTDHSHHQKGK